MTTTDSKINLLFENLDTWRHLPAYQLERRADIFFSLYLAEVLKVRFDLKEAPVLIPEFPCRIGTVFKNKSNRSFKIDYLAITKDGERVFFVELKTDMDSRSDKQDENMKDAAGIKSCLLFNGLNEIYKASQGNAKHKYLALYTHLHKNLHTTLRPLPKITNGEFAGSISCESFRHFFGKLELQNQTVVYVQPNLPDVKNAEDLNTYIDFNFFANIVNSHKDNLSQRFAESLRTWKSKAGSPQ